MLRKQTPNVPLLFKEIVRNHNELAALKTQIAKSSVVTVSDWNEYGRLKREMNEYRRAAERALSWNKNKGATA